MTKEEKERLERFALAAMQGLASNPNHNYTIDRLTTDAVLVAQAVIKKLDEASNTD